MAEDKAFEQTAEHLRSISFALVSVAMILALVTLQADRDDIARTENDLILLRSVYQKYGGLDSRERVRMSFATSAAERARSAPTTRSGQRLPDFETFTVAPLGTFTLSGLEFLITQTYEDGGTGYERSSVSGFGHGSWGYSINDRVLADPTLVQLADCWDRLNQEFEVIVPTGMAETIWSSGNNRQALTRSSSLKADKSVDFRLNDRPDTIQVENTDEPPDWGFSYRDYRANRDWFIPVSTVSVQVRPQLEAVSAEHASHSQAFGPFRTSYPELYRHLGKDADKPASQLQADIEAAVEDRARNAEFEILGLQIKQRSLQTFGLSVLVVVQVYLFLQLRAFLALRPEQLRTSPFPWLPLYRDWLSRVASVMFISGAPLLPAFITWRTGSLGQLSANAIPLLLVPLLAVGTAILLRSLWQEIDVEARPSPST